MRDLAGKVAVVTGGGSGIGRVAALDVKVSAHDVDVANQKSMRSFVDEVVAEHGQVHVVVTKEAYVADGFKRLLPTATQSLVKRLSDRSNSH